MLSDNKKTNMVRNYISSLRGHRKSGKGGFTLLLAALVSSVVLALGVSIFTIAQKQLNLSSIGRESQFAFYAADTGSECALFWDTRNDLYPNTFATSSYSVPAQSISCASDANITVTIESQDQSSAKSTFSFEPVTGKCTEVSVKKCDPNCQGMPNIRTIIHADGYNTNCASVRTDSHALQRSVELHY